MRYTILYVRPVEKELRKLPASVRAKIIKKIYTLADEPRPRGAVKLSGSDSLYRVRQQTYRIVYEVRDTTLVVLIVKVAHRREVYRNL